MPPAFRNRLVADLCRANESRLAGVTENTNSKSVRAWHRWNLYLSSNGLNGDPFLDKLSRGERHRILSAFLQAMRDARFSPDRFKVLTAGVVRATLSDVAAAFRSHDRPDPRLDADGEVAFILQRQLKGYKTADPGEKPQQAISVEVLSQVGRLATTPLDKIIFSLLVVAFFFAMRSCEYCTVTGTRRTKIIELGNVRFWNGKREVNHDDPNLHLAASISYKFDYQKNEQRNETITAHRTHHQLLCPVIQTAAIVRRLRATPGTTDKTPINFVHFEGATKGFHIKSSTILSRLRTAVKIIGKDTLGFTEDDIGLHSLCSGAAMSMYLQGIPVYVIMLLGRWSSDAFLRYIRRNVQEFSKGVSQKMIQCPLFFTLPTADREDPRAPGHRQNLQHQLNCGRNDASAPAAAPRLALWA